MAQAHVWPAWQYNPRPKEFVRASQVNSGVRTKLQKLVSQCTQDDSGVYHLSGTTFRMVLTDEADRELWT